MRHILVYGDSLSWGIIPNSRRRFRFEQRWPGIMEAELNAAGQNVRVIEDCLNGRRTVWDDPFKPGRNGFAGLAQRIEVNSPLALVVLMLGTNDFQSMHQHTVWHSAQGIVALVQAIRAAPIEPGMIVPEIMVVAPPEIMSPKGTIAPKFEGASAKCQGIGEAYRIVCEEARCHYLDAATIISASTVDGVHLDAAQHVILGRHLGSVVKALLPPDVL